MSKTKLSEKAKLLNIPRRNLISVEDHEKVIKDTIIKYKDVIFGVDNSICMKSLDELGKQQVIDEKVYDKKLIDDTIRKLAWDGLQKNIVIDGDMMTDIRTDEVLGPKDDDTHWKDKF